MDSVKKSPKSSSSVQSPQPAEEKKKPRRSNRLSARQDAAKMHSDTLAISGSPKATTSHPSPPSAGLHFAGLQEGPRISTISQVALNLWLDKVEDATKRAFADHNLERPVKPLQLPHNEAWCRDLLPEVSRDEAVERQVRLVLPLPPTEIEANQVKGTWKIAGWVSDCIRDSIRESDNGKSQNCPFKKLEIPTNKIPGIVHDLNRVLEHLDFLQKMRDLTRFAHICRLEKLGTDSQLSYFYAHCFLSVCSQLKSSGTALLPSDHFAARDNEALKRLENGTNVAGDIISHAMTAILQRNAPWSNLCSVHHFETNGTNSQFIKWEVLDRVRRKNNPDQILDRSMEFTPSMFTAADAYVPISSTAKNPKIFVRSKGTVRLSPTGSPIDSSIKHNLPSEILFLRNLLCINDAWGYGTYEETLARRKILMAELGDSQTFTQPAQRMHATQRTGSCELKSTTTAIRYLLGKNELSYQALIGVIFDKAFSSYRENSATTYGPLIAQLPEERRLILARIRDADALTGG